MPKGFKPSVFVSSTCFDLGQIRADLKQFIESLGYEPVLSDFDSFPVNPSYDTVKNCREAVKNRADIFILIVGGRYGTLADNDKSVTNLEYIEAKAKGTPIYVFVAKNVINVLPVWRSNKEGDFSSVVDSSKLFEFVESLRGTKDNWVFEFETAQNICATLQKQFAFLFMECLDWHSKITPGILDDKYLDEISPRALQILIEKPFGWEYRFFAEVLKDYIEKTEDIRRDLLYGVAYGKRTALKDTMEVSNWVSRHLSLITNTFTSSTSLLNEGLPVAFGPAGQPGDAKHIHYIAKRFADGYRRLLEWRLEFLTLDMDATFSRLLELTSLMATNSIKEIEDFVNYVHKETNHILDNYDQNNKEKKEFKLTLTLTAPDPSELLQEMERIKGTLEP